MNGNKLIFVVVAILLIGFGINHWSDNKQADQIQQTLRSQEDTLLSSLDGNVQTTVDAIDEQFETDRRIRHGEFNELVDSVGDAAASAVAEQFKIEREAESARQEEQRNATMAHVYIAEGIQIAFDAKRAIAIYAQEKGRFPRSNHEANIPPPGQMQGKSLKRLVISAHGEIIMTFDSKSGVLNGQLMLIPELAALGRVQWTCLTPNFRDIQTAFPDCEYDPYA